MHKPKTTTMIFSTIIALILSFSGWASAAYGASSSNDLKPLWNISHDSELDMFLQAPYHLPNTNTVYIHTNTWVNSETKSWMVSVVSAVDKTTGKKRWSFEFYKKGMPYPWSTSDLAYSKNGSVYALVKDGSGSKLYSVNSSGKQNWVINVPDAEELYSMSDGTLLIVNPSKQDSKGNRTPVSYAYGPDGKKVGERLLTGIYTIIDGQYVVSQIGSFGKSKLEVYGPKLNRLFTYTPPAGATIYINEMSWRINKSDILIRMNLPKTGNQLLAIDSKGKTMWVRDITGNASVQSIGEKYAVYENEELSVFGEKGLILKKALQVSDPMNVVLETSDNKIMVYSEDWKSVIDPTTLEIIYHVPYDEKQLNYYYVGDGYLYSVKNGYQLVQYKLAQIN
ncbi:PQQ-binding-like beta-propeller repeat protein [Paenibacillus sp. IHBB 3054]|uniref:PQQ-binding-like beta-propeller repeat protein n=1 Tax=Paenibacillus sp. IHBB 3054 TaxID=3425689 RepID=UPI003F670843